MSENYGNHSFGSSQASEQWLLARWEAYLTPNLLAVTQGSAGRDDSERTARCAIRIRADVSQRGTFPGPAAADRRRLALRLHHRQSLALRPGQLSRRAALSTAQEMVDWVRNRLLVKAGFELDHNADATSLLRNQTGTYSYSKVQNFISDALAFEKFGLAESVQPRRIRTTAMEPARPGMPRTASSRVWARCPATPIIRKPWGPPTGT